MKKFVLMFFGLLLLSSCVDRAPYGGYIEYKNSTHHTIEVKLLGFTHSPQEFILAAKESVTLYAGDYKGDCEYVDDLRGTVVFDKTIKVECSYLNRKLIAESNRYKRTNSDKFLKRFEFTFTEADYEYAVSAGGGGQN